MVPCPLEQQQEKTSREAEESNRQTQDSKQVWEGYRLLLQILIIQSGRKKRMSNRVCVLSNTGLPLVSCKGCGVGAEPTRIKQWRWGQPVTGFVRLEQCEYKLFHIYHHSKGNRSCINPYGLNPLKYHHFSPSLMSFFSKILIGFDNVSK